MGDFSSACISGYRGRLAPSPTGYLHLGHARTFWTAFERARAAGGTLVMRMEDLDPDRSRDEFAQAALEDLRWLGIRWQEGPDLGGPCAPYEQSGRQAIYLAAWRKLLRGGFLFPCRCSRKDLEAALSAPHEGASAAANGAQAGGKPEPLDDEPVYPGTCRPDVDLSMRSHTLATGLQAADPSTPHPSDEKLSPGTPVPLRFAQDDRKDGAREGISMTQDSIPSEIETPEGFNWRFRVPDGEAVEFEDGNLGPQRFVAGRDFGDFIVWRRDGGPSYQLACVADDAAMKITEVVRGEDLLKSTARQILLNRALGFQNPAWFHCRLMVDANGRRLAKRHDALSLRTLRLRGMRPMDILSGELPEEA
jgi:glutamyl-tRNA synthetase